MRPSVLFFDFVETVADVSRVPEAARHEYASKFMAIAKGREPFGPITFGAEWFDCFIHARAHDAIRELRTSLPVYVLTNAPVDWVREISGASDVQWDWIFSGAELGQYKPNPGCYCAAMAAVIKEPSEVMMVAAHGWDVEAARALGMQGWLLGDKSKGADGNWQELIESMKEQP